MEELKRTDYAAWKAFVDGRYNEEVDILAFQDTVVRALESIIARHQGQRVAVFCHGGVINVWAAHVLKMVPRLFFETVLHEHPPLPVRPLRRTQRRQPERNGSLTLTFSSTSLRSCS